MHTKLLRSCLTLCDLWTIAHQASLSMGFSRQEWSGLPSPPPGGSSQPRDWTHVFYVSCICRQVLNHPIQFSSVAQSCPTLCNPMDCSTPGFPVLHQLPKFVQTHVHWVCDAIQPSHTLSSPSPPAFNPSQSESFPTVSFSHHVVKVLEFQLQHQSFQWIFRTDFLQDWLVGSPCSPLAPLLLGKYQHR